MSFSSIGSSAKVSGDYALLILTKFFEIFGQQQASTEPRILIKGVGTLKILSNRELIFQQD